MPGEAQPLFSNQPIVNPDGTPTIAFMRWAQQRQKDITAGITSDQAQAIVDDWGGAHQVKAGTGLSGGGKLEDSPTLALKATGVDVGEYGDTTHYVAITVNAQGQIITVEALAIPVLEAPQDGKQYVRQNGAWVALTTP